jgi:hypothetical protein
MALMQSYFPGSKLATSVTMKIRYLVSWLITFSPSVFAIGQEPIIAFQPSPGALRLATLNSTVHIILDDLEWPAVKRAANDLAQDFRRVTRLNGSVQSIRYSTPTTLNGTRHAAWDHSALSVSEGVIIVGTLGISSLIDELARSGKIKTERIVGQWESFTSTIVESPVSGVSKALVIAGKTISYSNIRESNDLC